MFPFRSGSSTLSGNNENCKSDTSFFVLFLNPLRILFDFQPRNLDKTYTSALNRPRQVGRDSRRKYSYRRAHVTHNKWMFLFRSGSSTLSGNNENCKSDTSFFVLFFNPLRILFDFQPRNLDKTYTSALNRPRLITTGTILHKWS